MEGPMHPVMFEIPHQEQAKTVQQRQSEVLAQLGPGAPEVGEEGDVVAGAKHQRVHQGHQRQHQGHFQNGADQVVLVVEQGGAMQVDPAAADELPERAGVGQAPVLAEAEQAVGDGVGNAQEQHAEAPVQIEDAQKAVGDRRQDHPVQFSKKID